ncbi:MAG: S-methyl-5-thioribose-1-phosphate isomerase [Actinobacteria bacterium]|nr:S-methyl-5-thioribose-1-phosphate isomerase [Actinomycetota bacterium]
MSAPQGLEPRSIIRLDGDAVRILDQTLLPERVATRVCATWEEVVDAIRCLAVRGAPAIGIAGAMGVALAARNRPEAIPTAIATLRAARPTAVNLAWAVDAQARRVASHRGTPSELADVLAVAARALHDDEVARCMAIGDHGRALIHRGARVLTHCNAGALATGGYGTALGMIRAAHATDPTLRVVVDETRPLLQGARLTAWELDQDGIAYTLIADNMAAAMMAAGRVTHVVVGADRVAANGDVANKIGTYAVALLARAHRIPMIVAAPTSTIDMSTPTGLAITIETRSPDEMREVALFGRAAVTCDAPVENPAFDITPARLVNAIVTEAGVHRPPYDRSLAAAVEASSRT